MESWTCNLLQCCKSHWFAFSHPTLYCVHSCAGVELCYANDWEHSHAILFYSLCFALSSAPSWNVVDIDFNYEDFYNSIIDYFKVTPGLAAKAYVDELLAWWDKYVYLLWSILHNTEVRSRKVFECCKYSALYLAIPCISTSVRVLSSPQVTSPGCYAMINIIVISLYILQVLPNNLLSLIQGCTAHCVLLGLDQTF